VTVSGSATLSGTIFVNPINFATAKPGDADVVVVSAAGGLTLGNLQLARPGAALIDIRLVQIDANNFAIGYGVSFSPDSFGESGNPFEIGQVLNDLQQSGASATFNALTPAFFAVPDDATLAADYDMLSGEGSAGIEQTAFETNAQFIGTLRRVVEAGGEGDGLWAAGHDGSGALRGSAAGGTAGLHYRGSGGVIGVDRQIGASRIGAAFGFDHAHFSVNARATDGSLDGYHGAIYGQTGIGHAYLLGALAADFYDNSVFRRVAALGLAEQEKGRLHSRGFTGRIETGYRFTIAGLRATPFGAFQAGTLHAAGYRERAVAGAGNFVLDYAPHRTRTAQSDVGLQLDEHFGSTGGTTIFAQADWLHEYDRSRSVAPAFAAFGSDRFPVEAARAAQDRVQVNAGISIAVRPGLTLSASYLGETGGHAHSEAGSAGLRWTW